MPPRNSPDARVYRGVLVGLGGIARSGHLPAFRADPTVASRLKIVGIVDDAPNAPSTFDGIPLLSRPDRLSDLGPVDFVDICTPTSSHLAMSLWGLSQGYHVLCEKPVAVNRSEAAELATAALNAGRVVMPCHQYRFNPVWRRVKQWLDAGVIGRWYLAEFRVYRLGADPGASADSVPWRGRRAAGRGGVLLDHGTHLVYELLDVAGPPQAVRAWTGRLRHGAYDVEDTAQLVFEYPDRMATMFLTWAARRGRMNRPLQIALFVLGTSVFGYLVARIGAGQLLSDAGRTGLMFVPIVLLYALVYACSALAWQLTMEEFKRPPYWRTYAILISASALNFLTPLINAGGEPFRVVAVTPWLGKRRAAGSVILHRMLHSFAYVLVWFTAVVMAFALLPRATPDAVLVLLGSVGLVLLLIIALLLSAQIG